jgi:hypothetical protein
MTNPLEEYETWRGWCFPRAVPRLSRHRDVLTAGKYDEARADLGEDAVARRQPRFSRAVEHLSHLACHLPERPRFVQKGDFGSGLVGVAGRGR